MDRKGLDLIKAGQRQLFNSIDHVPQKKIIVLHKGVLLLLGHQIESMY